MSNISAAFLFVQPVVVLSLKINRKLVVVAFLLSTLNLPVAVFSQDKVVGNKYDKISWTLDNSISGVQLYHAIVSCNDKKVVLLRFINTNKYEVDVSWEELFVTKQVQEKSKGFYGVKKALLSVGETGPRGCNDITNAHLIIQSDRVSPAYEAVIENFEFSNITIARHKGNLKN